MKYPNIKHLPEYSGHWTGEAWVTGHSYGTQYHRSLGDAERWVKGRQDQGLDHPLDCVTCRECVDENHLYWPPSTPGEYGPYLAANGHSMVATVRGYRHGQLEYNQATAWCADDCRACDEGCDLPNW